MLLSCGRPLDSPLPPLLPVKTPRTSPKPYHHFSFNSSSKSSVVRHSTISSSSSSPTPSPPVARKRTRYRKPYPGENKGIVEEMRFVAMRLHNTTPDDGDEAEGKTWRPSMEGFVKYLVDSKLVFETLERIVDESSDVAYTYFRRTGLERSASLTRDLEWFEEQGIVIPEPSSPGITYAAYLAELAEKSAPSFLCHLYNIYFAHITGGQGIGKQVCEKLLEGRELEFFNWETDVRELLRDVREKVNKLGEHWSRDEKNRCIREAAKSFRFHGQIVRLIIL